MVILPAGADARPLGRIQQRSHQREPGALPTLVAFMQEKVVSRVASVLNITGMGRRRNFSQTWPVYGVIGNISLRIK